MATSDDIKCWRCGCYNPSPSYQEGICYACRMYRKYFPKLEIYDQYQGSFPVLGSSPPKQRVLVTEKAPLRLPGISYQRKSW